MRTMQPAIWFGTKIFTKFLEEEYYYILSSDNKSGRIFLLYCTAAHINMKLRSILYRACLGVVVRIARYTMIRARDSWQNGMMVNPTLKSVSYVAHYVACPHPPHSCGILYPIVCRPSSLLMPFLWAEWRFIPLLFNSSRTESYAKSYYYRKYIVRTWVIHNHFIALIASISSSTDQQQQLRDQQQQQERQRQQQQSQEQPKRQGVYFLKYTARRASVSKLAHGISIHEHTPHGRGV